jgi:PTH1 family peptidyl-tRNA hydrolase
VKVLIKHYNLNPENLFVIHDDLDLPLGKIRIAKNRGSAGHKGVQSIINELGTKDFIRFRIGIKPQKIENRKQKIEELVLQKFTRAEEKIVKEVVKKTIQVVDFLLKEGLEKIQWLALTVF